MSLLGVRALPVVNAELFCKRRVYSLPRESNSGGDGRWLPTHITHSISSSYLQLESLSCHVMVLQRMQCNWALIMQGPHLSCMSALPPLMSLVSIQALPVVNAIMRSLKSTARSRAVRIWTIKIGFDPAEFSTWIGSNLSITPWVPPHVYANRMWGNPARRQHNPVLRQRVVHNDLRADKLRKGWGFQVGTWNVDSLTEGRVNWWKTGWWSGWWVVECFFWYRLTLVVLDKGP